MQGEGLAPVKVTSDVALEPETWTHITVVQAGGAAALDVLLYVNGQLSGKGQLPGHMHRAAGRALRVKATAESAHPYGKLYCLLCVISVNKVTIITACCDLEMLQNWRCLSLLLAPKLQYLHSIVFVASYC
jgi:Concanavalin A-like lectin/glucanases superfamily